PDKGDFPTEGAAPLRGTAQQWAQYLADLAARQPFRTFVFGPEEQSVDQVTRFAEDVVPEVRRLLT
ncbi:hypothetical protein ACH4UV_38910, partial [Streptomyces sp. NPDC020802]|uniref:hypothetical protein n=1 Tax=Streptomyces sp. NPDC020802 TaxID=3365094 RepID=UPI0037AF9532